MKHFLILLIGLCLIIPLYLYDYKLYKKGVELDKQMEKAKPVFEYFTDGKTCYIKITQFVKRQDGKPGWIKNYSFSICPCK